MKACKQIAAMGATATTDEADSKLAAKSDAIQLRKGKNAKGKLAVKSNGIEKPKTHDLSNVTRRLAVMNISLDMSEDEFLGLVTYQNIFWMGNFKGVYDKPSVDAIRRKAAENWKFFSDSEKAPYVAKGRVNKMHIAEAHEYCKTLKLKRVMINRMMNLKM
ncbi:uncharacterized protein LOC124654346 isoform X2 [Lolium rigidum]|uniref:uncharacterized protein LOC124654346 isoform X2 n=1 Tax=Lolium rigidum TaxID=89674 RepID=UPI001F5CCFE1|nr:uncharacterized protein LOC124654346 isoform X2 [Lolium rigidum]